MTKERTEQEILADIRKEFLGLEQRAMTAKEVELAVWDIWSFVRENRDSLDSERYCRMIQEVINGAVESTTKRAESLASELDTTQQSLRDSKKEVKRLTKEQEKSIETFGVLSSRIAKAQDDIESLQAMLAEKPQDDADPHRDAA